MDANHQIRSNILELCSEDAHGSWEFWISDNKTESEAVEIFNSLIELVNEGKIISLNHNSSDTTYVSIELNKNKLKEEILASMRQSEDPQVINRDNFYWFKATNEGKNEDYLLRTKK